MAKRKSKMSGVQRLLIILVGTIFTISLFAIFWGFILENRYWALGISGGLLILFSFAFSGFSWRRVKQGIKKRF